MWVTQTSKTAGKKVRRDVRESRQSLNQVRQWQAVSPRIFMMSIYYMRVNYRLDNTLLLTESQLRSPFPTMSHMLILCVWVCSLSPGKSETDNRPFGNFSTGILFRTWRNRRAWHVRTRPRRPELYSQGWKENKIKREDDIEPNISRPSTETKSVGKSSTSNPKGNGFVFLLFQRV
jgi:hypothetical protein